MGVCELHFDPRFITRDTSTTRLNGQRPGPVLAEDAVPTIFPNTPTYLSSVPPAKRKEPDERRANVSARDEAAFQQWLNEDSISDFEVFVSAVASKTVELPIDWNVIIKSDCVLFVKIDASSRPTVTASFKVMHDMSVNIFDFLQQRPVNEIGWLLGDENKLSRWSQLPNICTHVHNLCS